MMMDNKLINYCWTVVQTNSDFDAKPMVMLLGQYSTGKTTFIKHLLKSSYPGKLSFVCAHEHARTLLIKIYLYVLLIISYHC
jgi:septin family protein